MVILGSGDWIGLSAAVDLFKREASKIRGDDNGNSVLFCEADVLKLGFLEYAGVDEPLKIYTFARQPITIKAYEDVNNPIEFLRTKPLPEDIKMRALVGGIAGDVFELHPSILERLMLLRAWWTGQCPSAMLRVVSHDAFPNSQRFKNRDGHEYWMLELRGVIEPEIDIQWDDLLVDRQEFGALIEKSGLLSGMGKVEGRGKTERDQTVLDLAHESALAMWNAGERKITQEKVANRVAEQLPLLNVLGRGGALDAKSLKNGPLKGWKFVPPKKP